MTYCSLLGYSIYFTLGTNIQQRFLSRNWLASHTLCLPDIMPPSRCDISQNFFKLIALHLLSIMIGPAFLNSTQGLFAVTPEVSRKPLTSKSLLAFPFLWVILRLNELQIPEYQGNSSVFIFYCYISWKIVRLFLINGIFCKINISLHSCPFN